MISIYAVFFILVTHWVADFVFQTNWMATNKSKSNLPLSVHVLVYTFIFLPFAVVYIPEKAILAFLSITYILHWCVDFCTSRITSKLSAKGKYGSDTVPNFGMFSIIGLDQLLHYVSLIGIYYMCLIVS